MKYVIELKREILWSDRKIDTIYKHASFLFRDRAKYKEVPDDKWDDYVTKSGKQTVRVEE